MRSRAAKATISSDGNVRDEEYAEEAAGKSFSVSINARSNETNPTDSVALCRYRRRRGSIVVKVVCGGTESTQKR